MAEPMYRLFRGWAKDFVCMQPETNLQKSVNWNNPNFFAKY